MQQQANSSYVLEVDYQIGTTPQPQESTTITFGGPNPADDLAAKVANFLTSVVGGQWFVSIAVDGPDYAIEFISGTNQTYEITNLFISADGAGNDHTFTRAGYLDPYVDATITALDSTLSTFSTAECVWTGSTPLVTAVGTGSLDIEFMINATTITLAVEIRDREGVLLGSLDYWYNATSAPYTCNAHYALTKTSSYSSTGPSDPGGPPAAAIFDFAGALLADMNVGAGPP